MFKKTLFILLMMVFSLFVLTGCEQGFDLEVHKATAMIAIESHADNKKTENAYTEEGLQEITQIVINGKQAINSADDKVGVDIERDKTILAIDEVAKKAMGMLYTLEIAFEKGWLTTEELQSIAYYYCEESIYHDYSEDELHPLIPKKPLTLSNVIQNVIKQTYLDELKEHAPDATLENVKVAYYFGTYGDCIIIGVSDNYFDYDYLFIPEYYIGEVLFHNYCAQFVQVWKDIIV